MSGSDGEGEALSSVVPISRCVRRQPAKSFVGQFEANAALLGDMRLYSWLTSDASDEATLTYSEMRARAAAVCVALRRKWGAQDADRAMLIYQPSLDLLVRFARVARGSSGLPRSGSGTRARRRARGWARERGLEYYSPRRTPHAPAAPARTSKPVSARPHRRQALPWEARFSVLFWKARCGPPALT